MTASQNMSSNPYLYTDTPSSKYQLSPTCSEEEKKNESAKSVSNSELSVHILKNLDSSSKNLQNSSHSKTKEEPIQNPFDLLIEKPEAEAGDLHKKTVEYILKTLKNQGENIATKEYLELLEKLSESEEKMGIDSDGINMLLNSLSEHANKKGRADVASQLDEINKQAEKNAKENGKEYSFETVMFILLQICAALDLNISNSLKSNNAITAMRMKTAEASGQKGVEAAKENRTGALVGLYVNAGIQLATVGAMGMSSIKQTKLITKENKAFNAKAVADRNLKNSLEKKPLTENTDLKLTQDENREQVLIANSKLKRSLSENDLTVISAENKNTIPPYPKSNENAVFDKSKTKSESIKEAKSQLSEHDKNAQDSDKLFNDAVRDKNAGHYQHQLIDKAAAFGQTLGQGMDSVIKSSYSVEAARENKAEKILDALSNSLSSTEQNGMAASKQSEESKTTLRNGLDNLRNSNISTINTVLGSR